MAYPPLIYYDRFVPKIVTNFFHCFFFFRTIIDHCKRDTNFNVDNKVIGYWTVSGSDQLVIVCFRGNCVNN